MAAATLGSSVLGLLPAELEIEKAIRALLDLWQSASSSGLEQNRMRLLGCRDSSKLMSGGWGRVRHALHLLQTEPAIKKLVISIVLDKAFWSAIMNNQSVQQFQEFLLSATRWYSEQKKKLLRCILEMVSSVGDKTSLVSSPFLVSGTTQWPVKTAVQMGAKDKTESPQICEEVDWGTNNLWWLLDILKDKIMDLVEKFKLLLIETLQPSQPPTPEAAAELEEKVASSLLLSVLIILIVLLARVRIA